MLRGYVPRQSQTYSGARGLSGALPLHLGQAARASVCCAVDFDFDFVLLTWEARNFGGVRCD